MANSYVGQNDIKSFREQAGLPGTPSAQLKLGSEPRERRATPRVHISSDPIVESPTLPPPPWHDNVVVDETFSTENFSEEENHPRLDKSLASEACISAHDSGQSVISDVHTSKGDYKSSTPSSPRGTETHAEVGSAAAILPATYDEQMTTSESHEEKVIITIKEWRNTSSDTLEEDAMPLVARSKGELSRRSTADESFMAECFMILAWMVRLSQKVMLRALRSYSTYTRAESPFDDFIWP